MENKHTHSPRLTRVFIVDDSAMIRERIAGMLTDTGVVDIVGEAECPADAMAGIARTMPDLVILDFQLRDGTGLEVLRGVHPVEPNIVFAIITSHPSPQYRKACLQSGASYFLDKSFEMETLTSVVANCRTTMH